MPEEVAQLFLEYPKPLTQLLYNRDLVELEDVERFLSTDYARDMHDPFLFRDMEKAVKRIARAIQQKEKIVVHGDYDADGVCSSVVLISVLRELGAEIDVYLPDREKEGYGLKIETVEKLSENGVKLLITADCGISSNEAIARANELDIESIIVDHHHAPELLPDAYAILNPIIPEETYPFKNLAAVGVAFKLVQAMLSDKGMKLLDREPKDINIEGLEKWLLDVVAIATVADMMPLVEENRAIVKYGLMVLNKTRRKGLQSLIEVSGLEQKNGMPSSADRKQLNAYTIGFRLGPRINAAGRLEHANGAYDLLMSDTKEKADTYAQKLNDINKRRQEVTEKVVKSAKAQVEDEDRLVIAAYEPDWHIGVLGLAAGRLLQQYGRPVLAMGDKNGTITGSGRSRDGFHLVDALDTMSELFSAYGGHAQACGFTLKEKGLLDEFKERFQKHAKKVFKDTVLREKVIIDAKITLGDIDWKFFEVLEQFEPFGQANPQPKFLLEKVSVLDIRTVGEGKHLKLLLGRDGVLARRAIGFSMGEVWSQKLKKNDMIDVVVEIMLNEWNGNRELQLRLVDVRKHDIQDT